MFGRYGDQPRGGYLESDITERGTIGWRLVVAGIEPDKAIGERRHHKLLSPVSQSVPQAGRSLQRQLENA
jgi:hypothetical protein